MGCRPGAGARAAALLGAAFVSLVLVPACGRKTPPPASEPSQGESTPAPGGAPAAGSRPQVAVPAARNVPAEIWNSFSGERAMEDVRRQVEIGPRPSGSAELEKVRQLIAASVEKAGWEVERQEFTDQTPRGPIKFINLICRFAPGGARPVPRTTQRAILCSHYDTKRFSTISFVGASDGASSTGALMELARVLALDPAMAAKVELVFFDGEEALTQFTETDGLYGSRYYAKTLRDSGRARQFSFGILWDMIGDKNLTITLPPDSPADLARGILKSADALGVRGQFGYYDRQILDDHVPLNTLARIPTIDLIDFDYLYWHTADDTLDKLSPASLQTVGAVTLHHLRSALGK